jgi:hypothetical protein
MTPPTIPGRLRCPWFLSGLAFGVLLGCITTAIGMAQPDRPPSAIPSHASRSLSTFPGP